MRLKLCTGIFVLAFVGCASDSPVQTGYDCSHDEVYVIVEYMPELANASYLNAHAVYPEVALSERVEGVVITQFVVNRIGLTEDVEITRGLCPSCDEEALRLVQMARFAPGLQRGQPVCVNVTLQVTFSLADSTVTVRG